MTSELLGEIMLINLMGILVNSKKLKLNSAQSEWSVVNSNVFILNTRELK